MNIRYALILGFLASVSVGLASSVYNSVQVEVYVPRPQGVIKFVTPEYPSKLAVSGVGGNGLFLVKVNPKTGDVDEVKVLKSCGHSFLNELAAKALLQWKFQPGVVTSVKVPVEFRAHGFSRDVH
jgi:TonB family protein